MLTFIAFLPCPSPQLFVNDNSWPHHDRGHGVAQGPGEGGGKNSGGATATTTAQTAHLLCSVGARDGVAGALPSLWWRRCRRQRRGGRTPLAPSTWTTRSPYSLGAATTGTACPSLRSDDATGTVTPQSKKRGRETRKGQVRGQGKEKRRGKLRATPGTNVKSVFVGALDVLFLRTTLLAQRFAARL